jgi:prepilin-type N-terminal cleavage/methylation domain-containing protein
MKPPKTSQGFTLIELLVVITLIAIIATISLTVMNYNRYLGGSRNTRRRLDLHTISIAIFQYITDTSVIPQTIPATPTEICLSDGVVNCTGLVDLRVLTNNSKYLVTMPSDPNKQNPNGTGYFIYTSNNGRVTVTAPLTENNEVLEVTR